MEENSIKRPQKFFYICSYGGCGSKMLTEALAKYGNSFHVHSRYPPLELEYVNKKTEFFNGIKVPINEIENFYVIYLYRNPVNAIKSLLRRFESTFDTHLKHIETDPLITINQIINKRMDLIGLENFYDNYTGTNTARNYNIYCVKYEEIFDKQDILSGLLSIGKLNLEKCENYYEPPSNGFVDILMSIYNNLIVKMEKNSFIFINEIEKSRHFKKTKRVNKKSKVGFINALTKCKSVIYLLK